MIKFVKSKRAYLLKLIGLIITIFLCILAWSDTEMHAATGGLALADSPMPCRTALEILNSQVLSRGEKWKLISAAWRLPLRENTPIAIQIAAALARLELMFTHEINPKKFDELSQAPVSKDLETLFAFLQKFYDEHKTTPRENWGPEFIDELVRNSGEESTILMNKLLVLLTQLSRENMIPIKEARGAALMQEMDDPQGVRILYPDLSLIAYHGRISDLPRVWDWHERPFTMGNARGVRADILKKISHVLFMRGNPAWMSGHPFEDLQFRAIEMFEMQTKRVARAIIARHVKIDKKQKAVVEAAPELLHLADQDPRVARALTDFTANQISLYKIDPGPLRRFVSRE